MLLGGCRARKHVLYLTYPKYARDGDILVFPKQMPPPGVQVHGWNRLWRRKRDGSGHKSSWPCPLLKGFN